MAYTKYSLTPADNNAAPPNGAPEGMLPSAVNDTMRDMMAQIRDVGDGIRGGTYTMTAPVITGGSITGVALSGNTLTNPVITGGSINNTTVGATTRSTGAFTTLASNGATTFTAGTASTSTTTGTAVITGGLGVSGRINAANFDGIVGANTAAAGNFTTLGASSTATLNTLASSGATLTGGSINGMAIGGSTAAAGNFTTLGATGVTTVQAGTVSAPAITTTGDTNTGIFFPAADTIAFTEGGVESMRIDSTGNVLVTGYGRFGGSLAFIGKSSDLVSGGSATDTAFRYDGNNLVFAYSNTERMRIDSSGNVGIGTSSPTTKLAVAGGISGTGALNISGGGWGILPYVANALVVDSVAGETRLFATGTDASTHGKYLFYTGTTNGTAAERMRIDSSGDVFVAKTAQNVANAGCELRAVGMGVFTNSADVGLVVNRNTDDGDLVLFRQANTTEGTISVSGTTVSYNGGHLSRWSQLPDGSKDDTLLKGTVMSNLDNMCVWEKDGVVADNEQLNKMKVSDVEGDANVAGVFVNWTMDEQYGVDDMNVAMTGDMIIRIADGVVVQKGDLLMSAGDGTAKPQGDDIVRSKTVAKVTSNYVTCTYADGSYCVPCVLMAC